jgi:hypothetical protein
MLPKSLDPDVSNNNTLSNQCQPIGRSDFLDNFHLTRHGREHAHAGGATHQARVNRAVPALAVIYQIVAGQPFLKLAAFRERPVRSVS